MKKKINHIRRNQLLAYKYLADNPMEHNYRELGKAILAKQFLDRNIVISNKDKLRGKWRIPCKETRPCGNGE